MNGPYNGTGWMDCVPGTGSPEGVCIKKIWAGRLVPEGVPNKNKGACIKKSWGWIWAGPAFPLLLPTVLHRAAPYAVHPHRRDAVQRADSRGARVLPRPGRGRGILLGVVVIK